MNNYKFTTKQKIYLPFKRLIDIFGSFIGIFICFVLLWWWVIPINAIVTKGHPFFVHERYGKHKKIFKMIKFRSMKLSADPNLAPSDMNVATQANMDTKFGKFLRKTSIDETMQLLNIFIGQMSFIGPRPGSAHNEEYLMECREKYSPNAFEVRPGISGLAQVNMKREHDPEEKGKWDSKYVKSISFGMDFKLFFKTVFKLFGAVRGR